MIFNPFFHGSRPYHHPYTTFHTTSDGLIPLLCSDNFLYSEDLYHSFVPMGDAPYKSTNEGSALLKLGRLSNPPSLSYKM